MKYWKLVALLALALLVSIVAYRNLKATDMQQIEIDLGKNIVDTARGSGVPEFSARNIDGLVSYSVHDLPADLPVAFVRPGFEASFTPVFDVTMYADEQHMNNLAVTDISLMFRPDQMKTHAAGQAFVESIIAKFAGRKWRRHIPALCPAVTGKSTFLDSEGAVGVMVACPLDPAYKVAPADWQTLALSALTYQWIGDGILATLEVRATDDTRGITYNVSLEYENYLFKSKRDEKNLADKNAKGDKQGWNSTAKYKAGLDALTAKIKVLEANAVARGDQLVSRPDQQ